MVGLLKWLFEKPRPTQQISAQVPTPPLNRSEILFVALDVETATPNRASICYLGLAFMRADGIVQYGTLVDPETPVAPQNFDIHGIGDSDLEGAPSFPNVMRVIRPYLENQIVVGHSSFDKSSINAACREYRLPELDCNWRDSINAAKNAWPDRKTYRLNGLANDLGLDLVHHDAVSDATVAAQIVTKAAMETGKSIDEVLAPHKQVRKKQTPPEPNPTATLFGQCICFTGRIGLQRSEAEAMAAAAGLEVKAAVSKKVSILVVGDQDLDKLAGHKRSSKHRKAEELAAGGHQISIISETAFLHLISQK